MKTATRVKTKTTARRIRRASRNRAHRSSYAISRDGSQLFRFATVGQLRSHARVEGLTPITALEHRVKSATLPTIDMRQGASQATPQAQTAAPQPQASPVVVERPFSLAELSTTVAEAIAQALNGKPNRAVMAPISGEQPSASRTAEHHDH